MGSRETVPIHRLVIGTAGHIDHGKSSLVKKLTGTDPDRLPEEQERGMTIDLGFAEYRLKSGLEVGIVDVPGHERFVKNMVAGATGIDFVLFVIAANDGIMPQTREHLAIMQLLEIPRGMIVLTKTDLVESDLGEVVIEEIRDLVRGTFLEGAPICPVSTVSGEGFAEFEAKLNEMIVAAPGHDPEGVFRMPIQRVFSAKGFGTVVTGIPCTGQAAQGDVLEVLPLGKSGRVRGLQAYKREVARISAGHRAALNLSDIPFQEVHRGFAVATPGYFRPVRMLEARLDCLPNAPGILKNQLAIRFHTGTAEIVGRMYLLERKKLEPGQRALVQFRLDEPVVAAPGDRFIVRVQSPMLTIGGGRILGCSDTRLRASRASILEDLGEREARLGDPEAFLEYAARRSPGKAATARELDLAVALGTEPTRAIVSRLQAEGRLLRLGESERLIHRDTVEELAQAALKRIAEHHRENPLVLGIEHPALRGLLELDAELFELCLGSLLRDGKVQEENQLLRLPSHSVRLSPGQQKLLESLGKLFLSDRFNTPGRDQIPAKLGRPAAEIEPVLRLLLQSGRVVELKDGILLHHEAVAQAAELARQVLAEKGELTPGDVRDRLGTSRKYIIPLLEHLDELGVTVRDGNRRVAPKGTSPPEARRSKPRR